MIYNQNIEKNVKKIRIAIDIKKNKEMMGNNKNLNTKSQMRDTDMTEIDLKKGIPIMIKG